MDIQIRFNNARKTNKTLLALLIDPDKIDNVRLLATKIEHINADVIFVGGSLIMNGNFDQTILELKETTDIPIVIFPGESSQVSDQANGILLLSLLSGRNAEFLIGQHVRAAQAIKKSDIEILPTGYLLIDGGKSTSVEYMSNTSPIPRDKFGIAATTALAGEQLGLRNIYLEAGSGAQTYVPMEIIKAVKNITTVPVIVGGGIKTSEVALKVANAGADIIVVGTAFETNYEAVKEISKAIHNT